MKEWILDGIINKLRISNFIPSFIYMNFNTYNKLEDEIQEMNIDYNSPTIIALSNIKIIIDKDLSDNEICLL